MVLNGQRMVDEECETWKYEQIFFAQDVHFTNRTFAFIKISTLDNLKNTNIQWCQATEYNIEI